jgi:NAD(P)-dependent dehydrogenase (short-subunit alcohol dehydrogenase family)
VSQAHKPINMHIRVNEVAAQSEEHWPLCFPLHIIDHYIIIKTFGETRPTMAFVPEPLRMLATSPALGDLSSDGPLAYALRQKLTGWVKMPATLNLESNMVLVTGATSGVGYQTARQVLHLGADLVIGARDMAKAKQCIQELQKECPQAKVTALQLDLEKLESVDEFVRGLQERNIKLDIAILNAGFYTRNSRVTVDGFDALFQVNFVATAYLALQILPLMASSNAEPARLVLVTSEAHAWARFDTQQLHGASPWSAFATSATQDQAAETYSTAKLLLALFGRELAARMERRQVCVVLTTPGFCASSFFPEQGICMALVNLTSARSTQAGARLHVYAAAVAPAEQVHGHYLRDGAVCKLSALAESSEGQRLQGLVWRETEALCQRRRERLPDAKVL